MRGARGVILYDNQSRIVNPDGSPGPEAAGFAPVFAALRGAAGQAILNATPLRDPIAILYSPASFRIQWMLEQRPQGQSWITRSLDDDDRGNAQRENLAAYAETLAHLGFTPTYIGPDQLIRNQLDGVRVLILPHAIALSAAERQALDQFTKTGGKLIADVPPGAFDEHGKPWRGPRPGARLINPANSTRLAPELAAAGVIPRFALPQIADATTYIYADGRRTIVAVQRDYVPNAAPVPVTIRLPRRMTATDLLTGETRDQAEELSFSLDPITPTIFVLTDSPKSTP